MQQAYSVDDFCAAYGIERTYAYSQMKDGLLAFRKAGRRRLIAKNDADAWLQNLPKGDATIQAGE
ncbi:helix-turn-helix domain-containing protein [Oryzicola mucosus]|nr:helix-turn-helix domain-containing protein [Oryzicola mucosus]